MIDFEVIPIGGGDFWVVLEIDADCSDFQNWCDERHIVLERRTFWYRPARAALIRTDYACEFWARYRQGPNHVWHGRCGVQIPR